MRAWIVGSGLTGLLLLGLAASCAAPPAPPPAPAGHWGPSGVGPPPGHTAVGPGGRVQI